MAVVSETSVECLKDGAWRDVMGPGYVDQFIRQAISTCWMMLPEKKKNIKTLEKEIRRLVDRALKDMKEDMAAFGITAKVKTASE